MNAPDDLEFLQRIDTLLGMRRTSAARQMIAEALAANPDHPELWLQAAWADYIDGEEAAALRGAESVLQQAPDNASARLLRFEILFRRGEAASAERVILDLLRDDPNNPWYFSRYAFLLLQNLDFGKARAIAMAGLELEPEHESCMIVLTICDFIEVGAGVTQATLQSLLAKNPDSIAVLSLVVVALEQAGRNRQAFRLACELVLAQPDDPDAVEMVQALELKTHWSLAPLWPVLRYGWIASAVIWVVATMIFFQLSKVSPELSLGGAAIFGIYVAYSWIWPPLLARRLRQ